VLHCPRPFVAPVLVTCGGSCRRSHATAAAPATCREQLVADPLRSPLAIQSPPYVDYIYEYPPGEYPSSGLTARGGLLPKHKCKTLEDYRLRYACYRCVRCSAAASSVSLVSDTLVGWLAESCVRNSAAAVLTRPCKSCIEKCQW
jgi:hypothetical protein